jgi:beta-hydroxylase
VTGALLPLYATLLAVILGSALYVHFRGRERLAFMRQLTDHSTYLAPYNALVYLFSSVPNRPMQDASGFPELAALRDNWQTIREEALALQKAGHIRKAEKYNDLAFNSFFKRDWTRFYFRWYGDFLPSARALCPRTVAILERTPSVHAAMFTVLAPHSKLVRHRDPFAGSLRYHLGLVTPNSDRCRIFVDGIPYVWRDGADVLFDETFVHRAENDTDESRIILFCDVERPLRSRAATAVNRFVIRHLMKATATENVDGEPVGILNRAFGQVYKIRLLTRRLKRWNRPLYYVVDYAAKIGAVVALVYLLFVL